MSGAFTRLNVEGLSPVGPLMPDVTYTLPASCILCIVLVKEHCLYLLPRKHPRVLTISTFDPQFSLVLAMINDDLNVSKKATPE